MSYKVYKPTGYEESESVRAAQEKAGNFNFSQQKAWDDVMKKIENREDFSYDLNGDALYQQYKDQYTTQGKTAMNDAIGQAAAMTGGYGNSYAQSVGQQTYQGYMQQLNDRIPELYQLALSKYNSETDRLNQLYGMYSDQYGIEYGQHRDAVGDYQYLRDSDWGRYVDNENLRQLAIQSSNEKTNFDEQKRQYDLNFEASTGYTVDGDVSTKFAKSGNDDVERTPYVYSGMNEDGQAVFYHDGKTMTFEKGRNPVNGQGHPDAKYGVMANGYQPDNLGMIKKDGKEVVNKLTRVEADEDGNDVWVIVNGNKQNVWEDLTGKWWYWDDYENDYQPYDF